MQLAKVKVTQQKHRDNLKRKLEDIRRNNPEIKKSYPGGIPGGEARKR